MNVWGPILAALLGGGLVQAIVSYAGRKKTDAEATDLISRAAERIVTRLEVESATLREQIAELRAIVIKQNTQLEEQNREIHSLQDQITSLRSEVRRLGGDPDKLK